MVGTSNTKGNIVSSSDVTVVKAHVLKGEKTITADSNDEVVEGTMEVNSLLSFEVAVYSGLKVIAKWTNPKQAAGKPYSGVYIRYSTNGYPGKTGGTQAYKGAGSTGVSGALSNTYITLPALATKYYLSIYPYVTCSAGEMLGEVLNAVVTTPAGTLKTTITSSQVVTIPAGYTLLDVFCVGPGGNGSACSGCGKQSYPITGGSGGAGGFTVTKLNIPVSAGQQYACTIGTPGGSTSFGSLVVAKGGGHATARSGEYDNVTTPGSGGSGGGTPQSCINETGNGGHGGSNGSKGYVYSWRDNGYVFNTATGQGSTTRAFGEANGTLYSGGGGSGGNFGRHGGATDGYYWAGCYGGAGGPGGGGAGGVNGSPNTGGGGGGQDRPHAQAYWPAMPGIPSGGTGIILIRLH